jgi:hypothetical protein
MSATIATPPARERLFYCAMALAIFASVFYGFYRSYFLYRWYPEWQVHVPPERFFWLHGTLMVAWFALLIVQPMLIASGRRDLHMKLGRFGAVLAIMMAIAMTYGAVLAAARPGGFIDVPEPPLQFLLGPIVNVLVFSLFVTLAILNVRDPQRHKRWMLLASISMLGAAIVRWQIGSAPLSETQAFLVQDAFLLPLLGWDHATRGRPHPVTLAGAAILLVSEPLRRAIAQTDAWLGFAQALTSLVG